MAIKTSTFGGVTLTGSTATAFKKQFLSKSTQTNQYAEAALARGRLMLKEYSKKGFITIKC